MSAPEPLAVDAAGVTVRGEFTAGATPTWLVLVHDAGGDLDDWRPLTAAVAAEDWNVIAIDLPGHGGSEGEWSLDAAVAAVQAGVEVARGRGARHVAILVAGRSAMPALESVARSIDDPAAALADSMVLLSPGPLDGADLGRMRGEGLSKLIISGSFAPGLDDAVELMQASIGWTVAVRFPSAERGTGLLGGDHAISVADKITSFVREQAEQSGPGLLRDQAR